MNWLTKAIKFGEKIKRVLKKRPSKEEIENSEWTSCCKGPILKKELEETNEEISEEGILAEPVIRENIDFDKEEKVTSVALDEFLDGDIDWNKTEESIEH